MTALPFAVALVGMVLIGRHSDRTGERKGHVAACAMTGALGLVLAAGFHDSVPLIVFSFALSQLGQRSVQGVFWAIPPIFLGGTAAAAGIALINSVGNLGGFVGPTVMGWLRGVSGSYSAGLLVLAAALVFEAVLVMTLRLPIEPGRGRRAREVRLTSPRSVCHASCGAHAHMAVSLADEAYLAVRDEILRGQLRPGTPLSRRRLACSSA